MLALGVVKLLVKFPEEVFSLEFPKVLGSIVKNLKSKIDDVRESNR
jgi:hypothetical protein